MREKRNLPELRRAVLAEAGVRLVQTRISRAGGRRKRLDLICYRHKGGRNWMIVAWTKAGCDVQVRLTGAEARAVFQGRHGVWVPDLLEAARRGAHPAIQRARAKR